MAPHLWHWPCAPSRPLCRSAEQLLRWASRSLSLPTTAIPEQAKTFLGQVIFFPHIFLQLNQSKAQSLYFQRLDIPLSGRIFSFPVIRMPIPSCTEREKTKQVWFKGWRSESANTEECVFHHLGSAGWWQTSWWGRRCSGSTARGRNAEKPARDFSRQTPSSAHFLLHGSIAGKTAGQQR